MSKVAFVMRKVRMYIAVSIWVPAHASTSLRAKNQIYQQYTKAFRELSAIGHTKHAAGGDRDGGGGGGGGRTL